jgi:MFS family permease
MSVRSRAKHRIRRKPLGRPFIRLWAGFALASSGDGLLLGAVPLLAVFVDPNPLAVSAVAAADRLPWLLLALPAGSFADRFARGPLMAISNLARAVAVALGAFLILDDRMTLAVLIVVVLINAGCRAMYYSAAQAIVPELVGSRALEHANGVLSGTEAGAEQLAGPVLGTWLFTVNKAIPFFADAVVTALSCIPLVGFRSRAPQPEGASGSTWEGLRLLFADERLRLLLLMVGTLAGLQGMEGGILVLLATKIWGVGTAAYGLFLAAGAAGFLVGSLWANRLVRGFGNGQTLIGAALVSGVGYLIMAASNGWQLAGPVFAVVNLAIGAGSVVAISLRQRLTPPDLMGRVGSAWRGLVWGAAPVGALVAGGLAAFAGLRIPLLLAGALQCAVGILLARPLLRSLRVGAAPAA